MFNFAEKLPHLPRNNQVELERILHILFEEFEDARAGNTSKARKMGRILHVILFGSFAKDTWVEDPVSGYKSDFDLLIIVNDKRFNDHATYWYKAEERILREPIINRPVSLIVHDIDHVNAKLSQKQYFFSDIVSEGIVLYQLKGKPLGKPGTPNETESLIEARKYFNYWLETAHRFLVLGKEAYERGWYNETAFNLHQACERAYHCTLLTHTLYSPDSHNIEFLRSLCENIDSDLIDAWPRYYKRDKAAFQLLKRAYVDARYAKNYEINKDQVDWLTERVKNLLVITEAVCKKRPGL